MNQKTLILKYMKDFGSISATEAMNDLGCMRLASRISELRKEHEIEDKWEKTKNRYGDTVNYKRYFLKCIDKKTR